MKKLSIDEFFAREYKVIFTTTTTHNDNERVRLLEAALNRLGKDGFSVVCDTTVGQEPVIILERPLPVPEKR